MQNVKHSLMRIYNHCFAKNVVSPPSVVSPPTVGVVCLSDVCNCECIMCAVRTQRKLATDRFMPVETYKKILKLLPPTLQIFVPSGLGDIMLHPSFPEVISISKQNYSQTYITTNGTMLSKYIDVCLLIDQVQVSLYASNNERYQTVTNRNFFPTVVNGIRSLIQAGHKNVQFNFVVQRETVDDIRDFVDLAKKLHVNRVNLIPCIDTRTWQAFNPNLSKEVAYGRSRGIDVAVMGKGKGNICMAPFYNFSVDADFNVPYCCMFPTKEPAGNLLEDSWGSIWYGKKFEEWRKQLLSSSNPPLACVNCP